jgi:hypothetical protein
VDGAVTELEQLRGFALTVWEFCGLQLTDEDRERICKSKSIRGVREAARDMVEMCQDFNPAQVAVLDERLARDGLPTLSAMRNRTYRELLQILTRGEIRSDEEFRLVSAFVSDVDSRHLSDADRAQADALMYAYEGR